MGGVGQLRGRSGGMGMTDINIVEKTDVAHLYPDAFAEIRRRWLEFVEDETADVDDYSDTMSAVGLIAMREEIPEDDRADLIVAGFWAAQADARLNMAGEKAHRSEEQIREALDNVW